MISEKVQNRTAVALKAIRESSRSPAEQDILAECLTEARDATNGFPVDEKVPMMAECIFNVIFILISHLTEKPPCQTWKEVIIACRHEIVLAFGLLVILLALRPQIATVVESLF